MSLISKRYADAFFQLSLQNNKVEESLEDLQYLADAWTEHVDFRGYMKNPMNGPDKKEKALKGIFQDNISEDALNFTLLLMRKGRLELLPDILEEYRQLKDRSGNILSITVITAAKAEPEILEKISEKFRQSANATSVNVTEVIDPSIIGGVMVQVGDKLYDDSVKGKLKALQEELVK